jgi:hypothetical protein
MALAKEGWPKTPDGTTDWEAVFEAPDNGLIPLILQGNSPQALRDCAIVTIQMLFSRENDAGDVKRITRDLEDLVQDNTPDHRLRYCMNEITGLLRRIKQERIELAQEYVDHKKLAEVVELPEEASPPEPSKEKVDTSIDNLESQIEKMDTSEQSTSETVATDTKKPSEERRSPRTTKTLTLKQTKSQLNKPMWAISAAIIIAVGLGFGIFKGFGPTKTEVAANKWVEWSETHVKKRLPNEKWVIVSAQKGKDKSIIIDVLINDKNHLAQIKSTKRMLRAQFLNSICPLPESGVKRMTSAGWNLWITLKSKSTTLTGGTCKY